MNLNNINKLNARQFEKVLAKEGYELQDYYNPEITYKVFFRRVARGRSTSPMTGVRIFYLQSSNIHIGTTLIIQGEPYIVYSQDAMESGIYCTSVANRCNSSLKVTVNGIMQEIPMVVLENRYNLNRGFVSTVSGTVILYGQDNTLSRAISVDDEYNKFGNFYKVANKFYNDGLAYFNLEQTLQPAGEYTLTYDGETTFFMDETTTYQTIFNVRNSDIPVDPQPELTYSSSDSTVASIDSNGLMTFYSAGSVTITCVCDDPSLSTSVVLTIGAARVRTYSISVFSDTWYIGSSNKRVFTLHTYDPTGVEDTETYFDNTHTYGWSTDLWQDKIIWTDTSTINQKRGEIDSSISSDAWGTDVTVIASLDGTEVARKTMTIQRF